MVFNFAADTKNFYQLLMKTINLKKLAMVASVLLGTALVGCGDDGEYSPVDNQKPSVALTTDEYHAEYGRELMIEGTINDKDGIRSIQLVNKDLYLNKTIDILSIYGDSKTQYDLSYKITVPDSLNIEVLPVKVIVSDLVGNQTESVYTIKMDGDYTPPAFVSSPDDNIDIVLPAYTLKFSVQDNKEIKRIVVKCDELGLNDEVSVGSAKYQYNKELQFRENGKYEIAISAYDKFDNVVEKSIIVERGDLKDFEKMYLSDVADEADLTTDICGVPMLISHTGPFTYHGEYYNRKPGTPIRFLPQKSQFAPICFGKDPKDSKYLTMDPEAAEPIILDEVGYYKFDFNISTYEYSYSKMDMSEIHSANWDPWKDHELGVDEFLTDSDQKQPLYIILAGAGWEGYSSTWNPRSWESPQLQKDENNPYLLSCVLDCIKGKTMEFTITASHWWGYWPEPFWRFEDGDNDSKENEYNTPNGGNNMTKMTVPATGKYEVLFDTYLLRTMIIPVK